MRRRDSWLKIEMNVNSGHRKLSAVRGNVNLNQSSKLDISFLAITQLNITQLDIT